MALKISLKAGERFVINGAVMRNGDRRGNVLVENHAAILREKDIMQAEEANSPARRIYFACMCAYLDREQEDTHFLRFTELMTDFLGVIENQDIRLACIEISQMVMGRELYSALSKCRDLIAYEDRLLEESDDSSRVQTHAANA